MCPVETASGLQTVLPFQVQLGFLSPLRREVLIVTAAWCLTFTTESERKISGKNTVEDIRYFLDVLRGRHLPATANTLWE
jgi:hypothetical protein